MIDHMCIHSPICADWHEFKQRFCKPSTAPYSDCGNWYAEERDCEGVEVEDRGMRGGRMTHPSQQPEYIAVEEDLTIIEEDYPLTANRIRSRPHTSTPLTKFVEHLSRINQELGVVSGKLENLKKIIDADEMTSDLWDDYANLEGWREALDWAILADSDFTLQRHNAAIRNATLDEVIEWIEREDHYTITATKIIKKLESLRTQPRSRSHE